MFADYIQHNYSEVKKRSEITKVIGKKLREISYAKPQKHEDPQKQSDITTIAVITQDPNEVQKESHISTEGQKHKDGQIGSGMTAAVGQKFRGFHN